MKTRWLLYGATGYTGRLIAKQAQAEGKDPILAARNRECLAHLGGELQLEFRAFPLEQAVEMLADVAVVLHCAGPFSETSAPMRAACRTARCHYLDITGELSVFEDAHAEDKAARDAGVVLCPGVGFDVIPTDCLAACLHQACPTATSLTLSIETKSGLSRGTKLSGLESLLSGTAIRKDGKLLRLPIGSGGRNLTIGTRSLDSVPLPFGDVATAWYSTGIPNIQVLTALSLGTSIAVRILGPLFRLRPMQRLLRSLMKKHADGPDEQSRADTGATVWGKAVAADGGEYVADCTTANVYSVTVLGALMAVEKLLAYEGTGGYLTPTQLLGIRCIEAIPGSSRIVVTQT